MSAPILRWERVTRRRDALSLQTFSCTTPLPRTPAGRKLPHPKPWEYEVQSHFRESSKRLKEGDVLLVGRDMPENGIVAAAHLIFDCSEPELVAAHIAAIGVCQTVRGRGGVVADMALCAVRGCIAEYAASVERAVAVATASIHRHNRPSELLFERAGFEPISVPVGEYQQWACRIR